MIRNLVAFLLKQSHHLQPHSMKPSATCCLPDDLFLQCGCNMVHADGGHEWCGSFFNHIADVIEDAGCIQCADTQ